ncbi:hypothetical protein M9458_036540 [Cirrhinus mrigala]|uniref:Uncharacterized protein n=1 Tax=Cirrhinus mrigala TaxID=683832 RepID=A0ABD0P5S7_CIRMR
MSVVSYINHQGSVRPKALYRQAGNLLLWADLHFLSVRAVHIPGLLNRGVDMLLRKKNSSRTVEAAPQVSSDDLGPLRESWGGSVHHDRECTLPPILLSFSLPAGRGRSDIALASSQAICISSEQDIAAGVMQDWGGGGFGDTHRPELAEPA